MHAWEKARDFSEKKTNSTKGISAANCTTAAFTNYHNARSSSSIKARDRK
jgi:hypothetical protein